MAGDKIGYDSLYKRALGTAQQLAQFLQAFDPQTAGLLRLESIEPRGTELFDVLPEWYRRVADIVAQAETKAQGTERELLLLHVEVQRNRQRHFGQRMLDYYTLLRRSTGLLVLPYAVLLYPDSLALGYRTYKERFRGRTIASLTYFQVSLPSLDAQVYAAGDNALARCACRSGMMRSRACIAPPSRRSLARSRTARWMRTRRPRCGRLCIVICPTALNDRTR